MTRVRPFLMFQHGACGPALDLYAAVVPGARILEREHWGPGEPGPEGQVRRATLALTGGLEVMCTDSPIPHAFDFTPSTSLFVDCADEAEFDALWAGLIDGGAALMPVGDYGFSRKFGWLNDRFGVSWQVSLG